MINWIGSWVQGIVIAVVISTIIEMILPDGNIKKYVRTVIGVYIVFVIISPIITKITGKEINLKTYELPKTTIVQQNVIDTNAYIESTYINKLKQDIIEKIEAKGYKVININIGIEQKETGYGNINKIDLKISKIKQIGSIQPIEIDLSKENKPQTIPEEEILELKKFLKENYAGRICGFLRPDLGHRQPDASDGKYHERVSAFLRRIQKGYGALLFRAENQGS